MPSENENSIEKLKKEIESLEQELLQKPTSGPNIPDVEPGTTYLLFESKPDRAIKIYLKELQKGRKGLYITRANPKQIKTSYNLGDSKLCWLTAVNPTDDTPTVSGLQELSILVSNQVDENVKSAILLDGLEYLVSNNDFSTVLRLIQEIRDKVSTSDSIMIIPLNHKAFEPKQVMLLERECTKI